MVGEYCGAVLKDWMNGMKDGKVEWVVVAIKMVVWVIRMVGVREDENRVKEGWNKRGMRMEWRNNGMKEGWNEGGMRMERRRDGMKEE